LVALAKNSFRASWITSARLDGFLREIDDYAAKHR
jgi:adenosine deaminase